MKAKARIAVIGDFNPNNKTHLATDSAINHASDRLSCEVEIEWVPTLQIEQQGIDPLRAFDAIWCSPGSPYNSMEGALAAIQFARESNIPFFGT